MGVFSELDLENQQTELDGHDSKTAEMQTLQAKLIQQHEQKKAAAAAEVTSKEPAAEPVAKTEAEQEDSAAAETERRRRHEEAEAKRKAEWERQQAEKRTAEQAVLVKIEQMSETELIKASMERMKKETERLTRRNFKECVSEYRHNIVSPEKCHVKREHMSQPEQRQYGTAETGGSCGIQRRMSRDPYGRPAAAGWNAATGYGTERTARRKSSDRWTADPPADGAESAGRLYCRKSFTNDAVSGYELFAESHVLPASADRQLVSPAEHLPQPAARADAGAWRGF